MRKLFHCVLPLGAFMIAASNGVCLAQSPTNYVLRNDSLVRENAQFTAQNMLTTFDEVNRAPFVEATVKAFERYWGNGKAKVNFDWKSYAKAQEEIDTLQANIDSCTESQKLLDEKLSTASQVIKDTENVSVADSEVMSFLASCIQKLQESADSLQTELQNAQHTLSERNQVLEQSSQELESTASSQGELSQAYASADILIGLIGRVKDGLATDIITVEVGDLDKAQELFDKYIEVIGTLSEDKYTVIVEGMGDIMPYHDLVLLLNRSKEAMASKYDADQNKSLADDIESLITTGKAPSVPDRFNTNLLTSLQKQQCQEMIMALRDQQRSAKNLNYLFDYLIKQNPDGIDSSTFDITSEIAKVVNIVNPSQRRYNPLYVNFNSILNSLETDFKAADMSLEELTEYIQKKKGQL